MILFVGIKCRFQFINRVLIVYFNLWSLILFIKKTRKCSCEYKKCHINNLIVFILSVLVSVSSIADVRSVKSLIEMRQDKVVVQQWDLSCGAAALTTLLNYQHNDPVTEKEVANTLMNRPEYIKHPGLVTIRQGFSLLDLKRYVDGRGYKGMGFGKLEFDDLLKKAPIIVPVNIFGYNHFVIFRGIQGNRVLLADPAWGNRTMLIDQFERIRIDFPEIGKVGFVIARLDGTEPPSRMAPNANEFVMTR